MKYLKLLGFLTFIFSFSILFSCQKSVESSASDIAALKASVSELQKRTDSLTNALGVTNTNLANLTKTVDSIKLQLVTITIQLTQLNVQLKTVNANITVINAQIVILNQQYADLLAKLQSILAQLAITPSSLTAGLVAYYPFSGNTKDSTGNNSNGTVLGNTVLSNDRFGNLNSSYYVNGINCPNPQGISLPLTISNTSDYSISVWFQSMDTLKYHQDILVSNPPGLLGICLHHFDVNSMTCFIGNGNGWIAGPGGADNWNLQNQLSWHNLIITKNSLGLNFYIDNKLVKNEPIVINTGSFNLIIGAYPINPGVNCYEVFKGNIDDVRIYSKVLTPAEITYLASH